MLNIEINNKEYNIPNKWEEMTIEYYCGLLEIIKKYQITEEEENNENDLTKYHIMQENKMYKELLIYMTGISGDKVAQIPINDVSELIKCVDEIMEQYKPKGMDYFEFEGDIYYFPMDFLRTATFGDYIESQQLELNTKALVDGGLPLRIRSWRPPHHRRAAVGSQTPRDDGSGTDSASCHRRVQR